MHLLFFILTIRDFLYFFRICHRKNGWTEDAKHYECFLLLPLRYISKILDQKLQKNEKNVTNSTYSGDRPSRPNHHHQLGADKREDGRNRLQQKGYERPRERGGRKQDQWEHGAFGIEHLHSVPKFLFAFTSEYI